VLLGLLALTLLIPRLGEWVERPLAFMTRVVSATRRRLPARRRSRARLHPVRRPGARCADVERRRDRVGGWLVVVALAYAIGAALPLLAIAAGSRRVATSFRQHAQAVAHQPAAC
jgi:hypothetical protein